MFNDVQDHVLKTAQTHIDRVVLEAFVAGIERTADADAKALLEKVCDLYALSTMENDKAWFLEHGQLTPARAKGLTAAVNQLLKELRPHIITLVDAFDIPQEWKACKILEEEETRQEAMAARDAELRAQAEGAGESAAAAETPGATATDLEVAPAQ
jgi:acyl-CoA oxidase